MNICLHFYWVIARSGMAGSDIRYVFNSCKKLSNFSRVMVPFYVSISIEGDFQGLYFLLSQKNYNVLYKTQTSLHFPTIQVKHIKCLHKNSKLMFSYRRLLNYFFITNHQPCCFVFHKPVMVFLECRRHSHFG